MRASFLVLGPLLARFGRARVSTPGGCAIGARPVDLHLAGLQKMGARIRIAEGYVEAEADRLRGAKIVLDMPSVGATQQLMMAASLAEGTTVIENAAREPENVCLATALERMGARVRGAGTPEVTIEGRPELDGADVTVIPDRIEAGTYMVAAAITGGSVVVAGACGDHLDAFTAKLREAGVAVRDDAGRARLPPRPGLRARRGEAPSSRGRHPARGGRPVTDLVYTSGSAAARRRLARLERRGEAAGARVEADVRRIIEAVRRRGDRALLAFTRRFDGVSLRRGELRVPDGALARAYRKQPPSVRRDLALAARRIRAFHARQRERSWSFRDATGARPGQRIEPLARVGVY